MTLTLPAKTSAPALLEEFPDLDAAHRSAPPAYSHGASSVPLLGETIGAHLRRTVERFGHREALVVRHQNIRLTYRELWDKTTQCARGLLAHGVHKGDRVGIWSPNRYEWVVLQYAAARVGAILVNVNPAYKPAELEYALQQSGVSLLVLARGFHQSDYVAMLASVRARCPDLRDALVLDADWDRLLADGERIADADLAAREATLEFDDPVNIQYTSGTTGAPKGATLSHHNVLNNGFFGGEQIGLSENDRVCAPVPLYHCFGCVVAVLGCSTHGACLVLPSESFEPLVVLETIQAERCTALYGVPTMFIMELEQPGFSNFDLSSLRTGMMGGAACPTEVMNKVQDRMHMREVTIICGMTETAPLSTQTAVDDPLDKRVGTVGRAHPHVEIKIVDSATGQTVPRGVAGEQCTRGYNVMLGYWNNAEATHTAIDAARWMHTGDLATMDEDGYVKIVGRIKDMVIRGGENIYPREIEEFLYTHPAVSDVQVIGVPDARYGEEVMAWVKLGEGADVSGDELAAFCKGRIASYKIPRYWKFVDAFPMTVSGKVQKFRMREVAVREMALA
jgi:fatty-acyl-CoA synthase